MTNDPIETLASFFSPTCPTCGSPDPRKLRGDVNKGCIPQDRNPWHDPPNAGSRTHGLAALEQVKALRDAALPVLEYVSRGRGYVDVTPYPDASARRALGALIDSGDRAKEGS